MMGQAASSLDISITKGVSGVVAFDEDLAERTDQPVYPCIRCGYCLEACPMFLEPVGARPPREERGVRADGRASSTSWTASSAAPAPSSARRTSRSSSSSGWPRRWCASGERPDGGAREDPRAAHLAARPVRLRGRLDHVQRRSWRWRRRPPSRSTPSAGRRWRCSARRPRRASRPRRSSARASGRPTTVGDWSAAVTGLLYGLTLPASLPLWMVVVGGAVSIGGRQAAVRRPRPEPVQPGAGRPRGDAGDLPGGDDDLAAAVRRRAASPALPRVAADAALRAAGLRRRDAGDAARGLEVRPPGDRRRRPRARLRRRLDRRDQRAAASCSAASTWSPAT